MGERMLTVWIPGPPVPKGRPRVVRRKSRWLPAVQVFTPERTKAWEKTAALILLAAVQQVRGWRRDGRYSVSAVVTRESRRGDIDNFLKSICDSAIGIAFDDDSQIDSVDIRLEQADDSGERPPGVAVRIQILDT